MLFEWRRLDDIIYLFGFHGVMLLVSSSECVSFLEDFFFAVMCPEAVDAGIHAHGDGGFDYALAT